MFRRILAIAALFWAFGFLLFAIALPQPRGAGKTDGVVVLTGGEGRIQRGLQALREGWADEMLVSGVDPEVKPREFAAQHKVPSRLMRCCVTLGYESYDTRSNAQEVAAWIAKNHFTSVRLITTDWHMNRASYELALVGPSGVAVIEDAVPSNPSFKILFLEYHKLLVRVLSWAWDR